MKFAWIILCLLFVGELHAQQSYKIDVPRGVVYKYCDSATFERAKQLVTKELTETPTYELSDPVLFIGPILWNRFQKVKVLNKIEGGNVTLMVDDKKLSGKMTQSMEESKKVWDQLRKDLGGAEFTLRKANYKELLYYWSIISFDIDEPLIVVETKERAYILDISAKTMKLMWLEEAPR